LTLFIGSGSSESLLPLALAFYTQLFWSFFVPSMSLTILAAGLLLTVYLKVVLGPPYFEKHRELGELKVGHRNFKVGDIECSIFYPCHPDTGSFGVPHNTYGFE
jgi:hypothetical protein